MCSCNLKKLKQTVTDKVKTANIRIHKYTIFKHREKERENEREENRMRERERERG